ncbi:OLC1v1028146C1 [Oldenlandia corymbosa var. corymbosa]|uniref:OLC1v1028146C1 n=1 Tax=Oldenlandia corymbosa var. corymbosa TaxID=529605 RepID=A0AAV1CB15_OLDCO|nr:OLC1v1028146C1 [Oldenlandia corymbosa var. corymbosa]
MKAVLSANPRRVSDFVLTVIYAGRAFLGFWRPGDLVWTRLLSSPPRYPTFRDVTYHDGKFYAVSTVGQVCVWDHKSSPHAFQLFLIIDREFFLPFREAYVVESSSSGSDELLVVTRNGTDVNGFDVEDLADVVDWSYGVTNFKVLRLDVTKCEWEGITSLGMNAIFVGHGAAKSVLASDFPGVVKPNCIYFTDDCIECYCYHEISESKGRGGGLLGLGGGEDMGTYNLEDGSIERFSDIQSYSFICPPIWIRL